MNQDIFIMMMTVILTPNGRQNEINNKPRFMKYLAHMVEHQIVVPSVARFES